MKIYNVKVNGKVYQVELESVETTNASIERDSKPSQPHSSNHQKTINSPMQGTIQNIKVKPGQVVKKGESLLVLEAMKLENDITAEKTVEIIDVLVKVGDTVDSDQPLIRVK